MMRNEVEADFLLLHRFTRQFIAATQQDLKDPEIWENFEKLCKRWKADRAFARQKGDRLNAWILLTLAAIADASFAYLRWRG